MSTYSTEKVSDMKSYRYKKMQLSFLMENQQEHKKNTQYALKGQKL